MEFHVIESSSMAHDVLLGREFLKKNGLKINRQKQRIQQVLADGALWEVYMREDGSVRRMNWTGVPCRAQEEIKYDSGNLVKVPVVWGEKDGCSWINSVMMENTEEFFYDGEIEDKKKAEFMEGVPGILDPKNSEIFIEVEGAGKKGTINNGEIVGHISSVVTMEGEGKFKG